MLKYYQKVTELTNAYPGTREGILDLVLAIDEVYLSEIGNYDKGTSEYNELYDANVKIRESLLKELADSSTNPETKASAKKMMNLYGARDVLSEKARAEAPSSIGRFFQWLFKN
jgi:hypothetical protein